MEIPKLVRIKKIVQENYKVKTFFLDIKLKAKPGQFVMVWIPGVDEKPISLSCIDGDAGITVEKKGKFTERMFLLDEGDLIGVRGPYGNGFSIKENSCIVAGGLGLAPLMPLIKKINKKIIIFGAKTNTDFLLFDHLKKEKLNICTDDGCVGFKGFTSDLLDSILKRNKGIKNVCTVGPEIMMKKVFEICEKNKINCEASLERFMKCGIGVCGSCCIGDQRVCKDGPVFDSAQLRQLDELGKFARLKSGLKVPLNEYYAWRYK